MSQRTLPLFRRLPAVLLLLKAQLALSRLIFPSAVVTRVVKLDKPEAFAATPVV